jgi:putative Mg2+ transporter-C (MgtC) family protein
MSNPWLHWWTDSASPLRQATFPRLLLAMVLGGCVGAERQWRQRAAGLRTNTLVCFGAAAFVDLGLTISPGTTQVVAYVVSGVGFLGAGAIMKDGGSARLEHCCHVMVALPPWALAPARGRCWMRSLSRCS